MSKLRPPYPAEFHQQMVELVRLRRQLRQVHMERETLEKATAWLAGRSDAISMKSSDS